MEEWIQTGPALSFLVPGWTSDTTTLQKEVQDNDKIYSLSALPELDSKDAQNICLSFSLFLSVDIIWWKHGFLFR